LYAFFFSSRRRHTRFSRDWSSDVCSSDLPLRGVLALLMRDSFSRAVLTACVLANFLFQVIVLLQILLAEQEGLPSYLVGLLLALIARAMGRDRYLRMVVLCKKISYRKLIL